MRIVLAVDGSDQSYFAARALEHLAGADKVTALHVLDVSQPIYPAVVPEVAVEAIRTTFAPAGGETLKSLTGTDP